jgi:hypothetical protein
VRRMSRSLQMFSGATPIKLAHALRAAATSVSKAFDRSDPVRQRSTACATASAANRDGNPHRSSGHRWRGAVGGGPAALMTGLPSCAAGNAAFAMTGESAALSYAPNQPI